MSGQPHAQVAGLEYIESNKVFQTLFQWMYTIDSGVRDTLHTVLAYRTHEDIVEKPSQQTFIGVRVPGGMKCHSRCSTILLVIGPRNWTKDWYFQVYLWVQSYLMLK
ncbi:MAG: hypothetical protein P1Q69_06640 [Candidatus Thorarchaeota archaeon]|nr:hypothetical protein [Candidatus Thorarchaeota archaeon]